MTDSRIPSFFCSFELELNKFIREEKTDATDIMLFDGLDKLLKLYIEQELSASSDITYNETLVKSITALFDVNELRTNGNEYVVRKYIRSILKTYVSEINKVRRIIVKDKAQMETMGLNIGFSSESSSRQFLPDNNVPILEIIEYFLGHIILIVHRTLIACLVICF